MKFLESYSEYEQESKVRHYNKWTDEKLALLAKKYTNHRDFRTAEPNAYDRAQKKGILQDICKHMKLLQKRWSNEDLQKEADKYTTRRDFRTGSRSAYHLCELRDILDKICLKLKNNISEKNSNIWTLEKIQKEANKYITRTDFYKGSKNAYRAASKQGILDKVCVHMKSIVSKYSVQDIELAAKKYFSRTQFQKGDRALYRKAIKLGILDKVCVNNGY